MNTYIVSDVLQQGVVFPLQPVYDIIGSDVVQEGAGYCERIVIL